MIVAEHREEVQVTTRKEFQGAVIVRMKYYGLVKMDHRKEPRQ